MRKAEFKKMGSTGEGVRKAEVGMRKERSWENEKMRRWGKSRTEGYGDWERPDTRYRMPGVEKSGNWVRGRLGGIEGGIGKAERKKLGR
jgi:hypothetical protein